MPTDKAVPAVYRTTLADEFRALADTTIDKNAADVTKDEQIWAVDAFVAFVAQNRARATAGGTCAAVNIPESDVLRPNRVDELTGLQDFMLRGGAAALRKALEASGFVVSVASRYNGHPRGEFYLEVRW